MQFVHLNIKLFVVLFYKHIALIKIFFNTLARPAASISAALPCHQLALQPITPSPTQQTVVSTNQKRDRTVWK